VGIVEAESLRRNRDFMLLWSGQTVSALGSQVSVVAFPLLTLALTGSPAKAGVVGFAKALPVVLLALPAGALADRSNRRYAMIGADAVRLLGLLALAVALVGGGVPFGLIVVVAFLDGAGFVVSYVAERGALRQLVAPEQLGDAVAGNESRFFGAMLAGPPLGGLLFGIGRAVPFLADAASYVISSVTLLLIGRDFQEQREAADPSQIREGIRWLWERPFFRTCSLLFAGSNPLFAGLYLLIVVLARRHGASSALIGVMLAVAAAGGLAGSLVAPALRRRLPPRVALVGENWMLALAIPCLLLTHDPLLIGVIAAAAEIITPVTNSIVVSYRVALAPDRLQGRVQAASTLVSFSASWLGPLLVGYLLQTAGTTTTILVCSGWALLLALAASAARSFRNPPALPATSG
jgi:predicted MFS family arabinose efflux permease